MGCRRGQIQNVIAHASNILLREMGKARQRANSRFRHPEGHRQDEPNLCAENGIDASTEIPNDGPLLYPVAVRAPTGHAKKVGQ